MAVFPRPSSPRAVWRDMRAFFGQQSRYKWLFGGIALAMPVIILVGFRYDVDIRPDPVGIVYAESWPANRSDDEIKADQRVRKAQHDAAALEKQRQFQRLADQLGIEH